MPRRSPLSTPRVLWFLCILAVLAPVSALAQTLDVAPQELLFTATIGGANPPSQTVQVTSDAPGRAFQVSKSPFVSAAWLSFTPTTGTTPATVTFSVNAAGFFTAGSQTVDVTISLPGTGLARNVAVTVVVSGVSSTPAIGVTPDSMAFSVASGAGSPPPQQLRVVNTGGGFLTYQVAANYPAGAPSGWLSVTPTSGSVQGGPGAPQNAHAVSVNPAGIGPGQYNATLRVTSSNPPNTETVLVTLTVASPPSLLIDPATLSFSASEGATNPPAQNITISSSQGGAITYQITSDQEWLTVDPGQGSTAGGSQLHAVRADITGLSQGNYTGNLTLTPESGNPSNLAVLLSVATPSAILTIPTRIDFSGSTRVPIRERRLLSIISNPLASGRWSARVVPPSATWLKISPASGGIPGNLLLEVDNQGLGAATLEAQIEITQDAPAALSVKTGDAVLQGAGTAFVPVVLTLVNQDAVLNASPALLEFSTLEGSVTPLEQILYTDSRGGPSLEWQSEVSTDNGAAWLSVTPEAGVAPTRLAVTVDPVGLDAGVHHGRIRLIAGGQRVDVPVSFLVQQAAPAALATDQTSLYFEVQAGTAAVLEKTIRVLNHGSGALNWSTRVVEQSGTVQWLTVTPSSGISESGGDSPPLVTFTVRPELLNPGVQSALVEIASGGPSRFVTVALNVAAAGGAVAPAIEPSGLLFSATATGVTPAPQQVRLRSNQSGALGFLAGASTFSGGGWLQVQPANGNAAAGGATLEISANHAGLAPGAYHGLVGVTFGDGTVRSAPVILTVRPAGGGCAPASASLSPVSPIQNFVAATGRAARLEAAVVDDCGNGVGGVPVLATFNNGDPALSLRDLGGGRYGATWAPRNAASQVNIRYEMVSGASVGETTLVGTVVSTAAPRLSQQGSVNGASFARGEALAPGGIMSTFGFNLASGSTPAATVPLPLSLAGVRLYVGGRQAPLFYADFGQINAQVPFEATATQRTEVIASVNGQFTVPQEITIAAARPGIFAIPTAAGPPRAIAQNQNFSLNGPSSPAARGEAVVVYLTGAGEVNPQVVTGGGAPGQEPFARVALRATATIGGKEAEILFLGLTPGFVGLAQANLIVPADAPVGPDVPVVINIDGQPSNAMVIAVGLP